MQLKIQTIITKKCEAKVDRGIRTKRLQALLAQMQLRSLFDESLERNIQI